MHQVTERGRRSGAARGLGAIAFFAFCTLFVTYGMTLEPAYAADADRAGDTFVKDPTTGQWIRRRGASSPTRRVAPPIRPVAPPIRSVGPRAVAPSRTSGVSQSAAAFARDNQLQWEDQKTFGVLYDGASRIRVYPDRRDAVVMGRPTTLKAAVFRSNGQMVLPACVAAKFSREVASARATQHYAYQQRQRELQRYKMARRTPVPVAAAPAKPAPTPVAPRPAVKPQRIKPVARTRPAIDSLPDAGWAVRGVSERTWKWIVLHHSDDTSGNAAKYDRVHRIDNGWEHGLGYHFVIGNGSQSRDGQVEVGPRWQQQLHGAHAKTHDNCFNDHGIGICLVGDFDTGGAKPTPAQMDHLVRLVRWLQKRYGIANDDVRGHCDCCATACPGKNFPWASLRRRIL